MGDPCFAYDRIHRQPHRPRPLSCDRDLLSADLLDCSPRVRELLQIRDGPSVELEERPAQGTRHEVRFGVLVDTGERVAVKFELTPGTLAGERAALTWLGSRDGPVPLLFASGAAVLGREQRECLVSERRAGSPPTSIDGWRRMGRAYARVAQRRDFPLVLPVLDVAVFGQMHAQRIRELDDLLAGRMAAIPDWAFLSSPQVPESPPLVITHGDPGPGNFLDNGRDGTIVDWEEAQIAPRGLDLARLVFIALLGSGPSGYLARDHDRRARAAANGYLEVIQDGWQPSRREWAWWITAAGVQFVHRRWQLGGKPGSWQAAADVLRATLTKDRYWPGL